MIREKIDGWDGLPDSAPIPPQTGVDPNGGHTRQIVV